MSYGETVSHDHDHHDHKPGFIKRWFSQLIIKILELYI